MSAYHKQHISNFKDYKRLYDPSNDEDRYALYVLRTSDELVKIIFELSKMVKELKQNGSKTKKS